MTRSHNGLFPAGAAYQLHIFVPGSRLKTAALNVHMLFSSWRQEGGGRTTQLLLRLLPTHVLCQLITAGLEVTWPSSASRRKQIIGNNNIIYHTSKTENQIREGLNQENIRLLSVTWVILSPRLWPPLKELGEESSGKLLPKTQPKCLLNGWSPDLAGSHHVLKPKSPHQSLGLQQ